MQLRSKFILVSIALFTTTLFFNCQSIFKSGQLSSHVEYVTEIEFRRVKYIAAIGDSILAGYAAYGTPFIENRRASFVMGTDENTVASRFNLYNSVIGASSGSHLIQVCHGVFCPGVWFDSDGLNSALSGSLISNINHQITHLVNKFNALTTTSNELKLVTLFIGNNDICASCDPAYNTSPENFEIYLRYALERIRNEIPGTIVNLMLLFNVSRIHTLIMGDAYCQTILRSGSAFECQCAYKSNESRMIMDDATFEYNKRIVKVSNEYKGFNGFGVIVDPVLQNIDLAEWHLDAVSRVDCFHPSQITHAKMSRYVWNNLFKTFAEKARFNVSEDVEYYVPKQNDTIKF